MDRLGWHTGDGLPDSAVFVTRGAGNGKLAKGRFAPEAVCYAFTQNDAPAQTWLADVARNAGCRVLKVATPALHKDTNDWTRAGATESEIRAAMLAAKPVEAQAPRVELTSAPDFARITADVRGEILGILTDANCKGSARNRAVAKLVVGALCNVGKLYFHAERRDFDSAMFFDASAKRLLRIRADAFGAWFSDWLGINRADPLFKFAFAEVETAALSGAQTTAILPESFWTARPGAIYLSNGDGTAAKITASGVALVNNGADGVLFAAGRTLAPWKLAAPRDFFETCKLFADIQDAADNARELVRLWTLSLPTNPKSKPPLCLFGEIGAGKTRLALGIAELFGLPQVAAKVEEKLEADFWPTVDAGGLFVLDNADSRTRWLADAVAAAATGGCVSRRRLYTNTETMPLRARAWLAITTANPTFANDSGLADRLLVVRLRRREGVTSDAALSAEIADNRDSALSFVAHILSAALADTVPTPPSLNQRHPDFASFAVRIGRALGRETEAVAALSAAESDKSLFCLQNDTLGAALLAHVTGDSGLAGDASELRTALAATDPAIGEWSNRSFGRRLAGLWPHVESVFLAKRTKARNGWRFTVAKRPSCGFAGLNMPFPQNPPARE